MFQYKRRNTPWLAALGAMMLLVMVSGAPIGAQLLLLALFAAAVTGSFMNFEALNRRGQLMQTIQQRSPLSRSRMSPDAREAAARASSRMGYYAPDLQLVDVGLIASQTGRDGLAMRRTRSVSKDDDGVRPFVTLHVTSDQAERNVLVRFEIIDHTGRELYIHEMKVYLRDGEMNILADHHLPLMTNEQVAGVGDWDLRVLVDGELLAVHTFALTASYEERRRRLGNQYYVTGEELPPSRIVEPEDDIPLSLEELLRNQNNSNK